MLLIRAVRVPLTKRTIWQQESEISGIKLKNGYTITLKKNILGDTVIKIWFMLVLMSAPNLPSVKYNGILYPTEEECLSAQVEFLNMYESRPQTYKDSVTVDAFCLPFEAFPIQSMNYNKSLFNT
jgi:hypothetical protein|tara:strand:- start:132 stop:506 length:375 start_codon:yes stop_codon:yes gene_type:complete